MFRIIHFTSLFLLICLITTSCESPPEVNGEQPFAVMANKYRNPYEAIEAKEKLENLDLKPYLKCFDEEGAGQWHGVFLGAYPTLESMMKGKIDFEDNFGLQHIERVNFNLLNDFVKPFDYEKLEEKPISNKSINFNHSIFDLIKHLPYSSELRISSIHGINQMDGHALRSQAVTKYQFDLPRGLTPSTIYKNSLTLLEVYYGKDFSDRSLSALIIKLKKDHNLGDSIPGDMGQKILNTREYEFEKGDLFNAGTLKGVSISIEPRKDRIKHYIILSDPTNTYLYILQSREKFFPLTQLKAFCSNINKSLKISDLPYINNSLGSIPSSLADTLVAYRYERIVNQSEKPANLWTGNDQSSFYFFTEERGFWKSKLSHFSNSADTKRLYDFAVLNKKFRSKKESLTIGKYPAVLLSAKRRNKNGRGRAMHPELLYFRQTNTIGEISNRKKAWLSQEDLTNTALSFVVD